MPSATLLHSLYHLADVILIRKKVARKMMRRVISKEVPLKVIAALSLKSSQQY